MKSKSIEKKVESFSEDIFHACSMKVPSSSEKIRLQHGEHGGSCVFFNPTGTDTRFGLTDGINGTMYLASDPLTAMKEVFQGKLGIRESDLENFYIGIVVIEKDLKLLDTTKLIKKTSLTLNDMTTSSRKTTQLLAKKVHVAGLNGIKFSSNVTTEECFALWHDVPDGTGIAVTKAHSIQRLSEFEYQGKSVADILVEQLGIPVEEG
ncbi:RES family NAD+ phosphorylase [Xenorhabdus sp. PB61.4]|uniref:RES family NAD+ phosphorylase n=1 Tax=Xenorhabdus sp. PB61.4 TaxID=2788940 RepID=UPI001E62E148|nr:RES family NAD+ phosphorylase [Xenorhabdus sp. PB61.4]MCC8364798.1 RES family NAD+ phosphorylase [Xenorhabdus sp. PB61.4]